AGRGEGQKRGRARGAEPPAAGAHAVATVVITLRVMGNHHAERDDYGGHLPAAAGRRGGISHSLTLPSLPLAARAWPSAVNPSPSTASRCPCNTAWSCQFFVLHKRTRPSACPTASTRPSGANATGPDRAPASAAPGRPAAASHTRTPPAPAEPAATSRPLGENATEAISADAPDRLRRCRPACQSHSTTSPAAAASVSPSGAKAT